MSPHAQPAHPNHHTTQSAKPLQLHIPRPRTACHDRARTSLIGRSILTRRRAPRRPPGNWASGRARICESVYSDPPGPAERQRTMLQDLPSTKAPDAPKLTLLSVDSTPLYWQAEGAHHTSHGGLTRTPSARPPAPSDSVTSHASWLSTLQSHSPAFLHQVTCS